MAHRIVVGIHPKAGEIRGYVAHRRGNTMLERNSKSKHLIKLDEVSRIKCDGKVFAELMGDQIISDIAS